MKGAYTPSLTPVARPGDVVRLDPEGDHFEVESYVAQPGVTAETITVSSGQNEQTEVDAIGVSDNTLGQWRLPLLASELPADVQIRVDHGGRQNPMWTTKNERGEITQDTGAVLTTDGAGNSEIDHAANHLTELFVYEDNPPYFTVYNNSDAEVSIDLTFVGFQFELSPRTVDPGNEQPVAVPVERIA